MGTFCLILTFMDGQEGKEDQREKKGREEDDRNIFLDRYKLGRWARTE